MPVLNVPTWTGTLPVPPPCRLQDRQREQTSKLSRSNRQRQEYWGVPSGTKLGTAEGWLERAETVRREGTTVLIQDSAQRWFAPGFVDPASEISSRLLHALRDADPFSYAFCCEALAAFDVREELSSIPVPTQMIAGALDGVAPPLLAEKWLPVSLPVEVPQPPSPKRRGTPRARRSPGPTWPN